MGRDVAGVLVYDDSATANDPVLYLLLDNDPATIAVSAVSELQAPSGSRSDDSKAALVVGNGHSSQEGFDGRIDDLALFGSTLTAAQAHALLGSAASTGLDSPWSASASATTERKTALPAPPALPSLLAPLAPANLGAVADGADAITLSWDAPVTASARAAVTSYAVQRSASGTGAWSDLATTSATGYRDSGLQAEATWQYRVRAETAQSGLHSAWSASASATTEAAAALQYDRYDTTGQVSAAGSYAFLRETGGAATDGRSSRAAAGASVITTYEGLREDADTLRIHVTDGFGVSRASFYGTVEVGATFEWREAGDCWVRYGVTAVKAGSGPREFAIRPYSHTYTGCSGALDGAVSAPSDAAQGGPQSAGASGAPMRDFTWEPDILKTGAFTVPTMHGPWLIVPTGWTGPAPDPADQSAYVAITPPAIPWPPDPLPDPDLGPGWRGGVHMGYGELEGLYSHSDHGTLSVYMFQLGHWPIAIYRMGVALQPGGRDQRVPVHRRPPGACFLRRA